MKRILTISTLLLFFAINFSSCEKYAKGTPKPIKTLIKERNSKPEQEYILFVAEYKCGEEIIYCFNEAKIQGRCHIFHEYIFDKEGNMLCSACFREDENCKDKYEGYIETKVIWHRNKGYIN